MATLLKIIEKCVLGLSLPPVDQDQVKSLEGSRGTQVLLEVGVILELALPDTCGFLVCS